MYGTDNAIPFNYKVADESTREKAEILKQKVDKDANDYQPERY